MEPLTFVVAALWVVVLLMIAAIYALARQVGVLFERVAPVGALVHDSGPKVGERAPRIEASSLTGTGHVTLGIPSDRSTLVFFLSPTCPVCKKLLPVLDSIRRDEAGWLNVVLASDGEIAKHRTFIERAGLGSYPYLLSGELGLAFRVARLPFAVLVGEDGVVCAKGLVNNREQIESLFNAKEMGAPSIQRYLDAAPAA